MQFQPPSFVQPNQYQGISNLGGSLDSIINRVLQAKIQGQQIAGQQGQERLQNMGITNAQVNQLYPQLQPNMQAQQPSMANDFQGATVQNGVTGGSDPNLQALANLVNMHMASRSLGVQKEQAGVGLTQAEASQKQSQAALDSMFGQMLGGGGGEWVKRLREDVATGNKAPSQAYTEASRLGPNGMGRMIVDNALAGLPLAKLESNFKGQEAAATFQEGPQIQLPSRMIESVKPILSGLADDAEKAGQGGSPILNRGKLIFSREVMGSPAAQDFTATREEARAQLAQIFSQSGAPTDVAQKRANEAIPDGATPAQLRSLASDKGGRLSDLLDFRKTALQGKRSEKTTAKKSNDPLGIL